MAETNFDKYQKQVCEPEKEPAPLKKLCAPCTPNPSYIEPDWEFVEIGEPYLNEKQCEYQVTVTVNKDGESFSALNFRNLSKRQRTYGSRNELLQSFVHPAIVLILEETGKLVADQIICASFEAYEQGKGLKDFLSEFKSFGDAFSKLSEQKIDKNRHRCKDLGGLSSKGKEIDVTEPFDFNQMIISLGSDSEIKNPFALELYARVNDWYIDPVENILKVHVGIPAFIVDQIPELPSKEELEAEAVDTRTEVVIEVDKLFGQITRLSSSLTVFGKYQSYFYQNQDGYLKFKESKKDFYANRMSAKVDKFYADLKELGEKNKVNLRSNIPSLFNLNADKLRIEFQAGSNGNPYVIKSIYAWKEGCEEKKLRKGIKKFKDKYSKRPTLMNYIAKLSDIDMTLQARETVPWLDFLVKYTYPLLTVDYGSLDPSKVGESLGKCVENNIRDFGGDLKDYILNEALNFAEALSFQYSSAASCAELYSTENEPEKKEFEDVDFGLGEGLYERTSQILDARDPTELDQQISDKKLALKSAKEQLKSYQTTLRDIEKTIDDTSVFDPALEYLRDLKLDRDKRVKNAAQTVRDLEEELKEIERKKKIEKKEIKTERKDAIKKARKNAKSHPYAKKAYKAAMSEFKQTDGILSSLIDWEEYEDSGKLTAKKLGGDKDKLKEIVTKMSICTLNSLTINATRCLFSGVTKERAFDKMFRAAMKAMDLDVFGFFIGGLPPGAQAELRKKIEEEFGNIPLPWEEEYKSGKEKNNYKEYLSSKSKERKEEKERLEKNLNEKLQQQIEIGKSENPSSDENKARIEKAAKEVQEIYDQMKEFPETDADFKNLTDEEKRQAIEEQKKDQGTFGTALGNIQEEIIDAYIEYIFDVMNYEEIGDALSQVPGGELVFNTVNQIFKCSTQGMFNPPIKSFLSSFTLDTCGEDKNIGISWPEKVKPTEFPSFSRAFFIKKLKNLFVEAVENLVTKVITMLLLKLLETVDNAICKSLNAIGQAAIGALTGGPGAGLDEAFADAFCPTADEDELNNVKKNLFGNALGDGAAPDSAYDCLFKAINGVMSKREIIDLLTNTPANMDEQTATRFALLVNSKCPELSDLLGDVESVKDAFGSMGKYIPPELKDYLQNQPDQDLDAPIYDAVCLTQDELDLWNQNRKQLYLDNGLDEATADELINKANDRVLDNLGSVADILQKGPEGLLEDALNQLMDPTCNSGIVMEDEELASKKAELMNDYFKRIESKFLEDLIGERRSLIGNILIDSYGNHLQQHNRRASIGDRTFLYADYVDTEDQWSERKENAGFIKDKLMDKDSIRGVFPETVGAEMLNQLRAMEFKYKTSKDEPQLKMAYNTKIHNLFNKEDYKTVLRYKLNHNKKSTQRAFVKETTENMFGKKSTDLVLSARNNQVFNLKDLGIVNYEVIPNEVKLFSDLLKEKSNSTTRPTPSKTIKLFDNLNSKALRVIRDAIVETPTGDTPTGFNFGYDEQQAVNFRDLLYVNPDADPNDEDTWEYTFEEEDGVLGKSATENPRVYFLDPAVHGGRYRAPKIYIEAASYNGWLGTIKAFVPQASTCEEKDDGFLNITQISKRSKEVEGNLPIDKRLSQPLECRLEVPYDRQIMPANHGLMEGIVISTLRVYASEYIVRAFPIHGSISFSDMNVDNLVTSVIGDYIQREMSDAGVFSNISRLAYYLLFLEQCVQVVQRQIIDGLMEETEEMREASKIINKAQNNYEKLKFGDFIFGDTPSTISEQIKKGTKIIAYGVNWAQAKNKNLVSIRGITPYKINLARKVSVIHDTQAAAEVFLSALLKQEIETLSTRLNSNLRPQPHVFDVRKYMLSKNGIVDNSDIKSGFAVVEQEVVEGSNKPDYGSIIDCALQDLRSPIGIVSRTSSDIGETGFMYLEKYLRVFDKEGNDKVMTIGEFQETIKDRSVYDENMKISDYFGNAELIANKVMGTIGVKFGVRLLMCLPHSIGLTPDLDRNKERLPNSIQLEETFLNLHHIPVASYELDVIDKQIKDIDTSDVNMGEDIKCYVDMLCETDDFNMLFDKVIKPRTFVSLFGIYSFQNFLESIGKEEVEKDRLNNVNEGWKKVVFNDTKRLLRKQFRSIYNSQDDESPSRSRKRDSELNFLKNLMPDVYLNVRGVGILQRLRIVDANPFDENGKACVNEFQKLFEDD